MKARRPDPDLVARFTPIFLDAVKDLPDPRWLLADHLPAESFAVLFGPPGTYKSFLALDWSLSIAHAIPWLDRAVSPCPVVYVFAEGTFGARKRIEAWHAEHGRAMTRDVPFAIVPCPIPLPGQTFLEAFIAAVEQAGLKPGLIVLDTLARNHAGDENQTADMGKFVGACDALKARFGATVLVVHHTGKDVFRGARGSIALEGATEAMFETKAQAGGGETGGTVELWNRRQKDAPQVKPYCLDFVPVSDSLVCRMSDALPGSGNDDERVLELLKTVEGGLKSGRWRELTGLSPEAFNNARGRLISANRVKQLGGRGSLYTTVG